MLQESAKLFLLALAVSSISLTVSRAKLFADLREFVKSKNVWLGKLLSCPYCTSHWVSFIITALYLPRPIHLFLLLDWFLASMMIVALSAMLMGVMFLSISMITPQVETEEDEK